MTAATATPAKKASAKQSARSDAANATRDTSSKTTTTNKSARAAKTSGDSAGAKAAKRPPSAQAQAQERLQDLREQGNPDGDHDPTSSALAPAERNAMETLPEGHTYRDRVEAQARSLGVGFTPDTTTEYLMFLIRMKASS